MKNGLFCILLLFLTGGCVSYEYDGSSAAPTEEVTIYADRGSVMKKYTLLGAASVSGNYRNVSHQMLLEKLQTEAKKNGADAVIILEDRIVPGRTQNGQTLSLTASDRDDMTRSYRETCVNFAGKDQAGTLTGYRRMIRAEFVKFGTK